MQLILRALGVVLFVATWLPSALWVPAKPSAPRLIARNCSNVENNFQLEHFSTAEAPVRSTELQRLRGSSFKRSSVLSIDGRDDFTLAEAYCGGAGFFNS